MNLNKNLMLVVAIVGIGLFVLPSTLSMFAGQHSWYDPRTSTGIPCEKCHYLEKEELAASEGPHDPDYTGLLNTSAQYNMTHLGQPGGTDFWGGDTVNDRCYGCHQTTGSINQTNILLRDDWNNSRNYTHAAVAVFCTDCHPWVKDELINTSAAHKPFYEDISGAGGNDTIMLKKENQVCLGCHTHVGVNISWTRAEYVSYDIVANKSGYTVTWNATDELGSNATEFESNPGY